LHSATWKPDHVESLCQTDMRRNGSGIEGSISISNEKVWREAKDEVVSRVREEGITNYDEVKEAVQKHLRLQRNKDSSSKDFIRLQK